MAEHIPQRPDHFCKQSYDAALEIASEYEGAEVVHAWLQTTDGLWIQHAFAEVVEKVGDLTQSRIPFDKDVYYKHMGITEERLRRYDRIQFFTLVGDMGTMGPFDHDLFFAETSVEDPLDVMKK